MRFLKPFTTFLSITAILLLNINPAQSESIAPSFDCAKVTTEVEKLICSDNELAKLDVEMNKWYKKAHLWRATYSKESKIGLQNSQNKWLQRRNKFECLLKETDKKKCLTSLYNEAIQVWKNKLLEFEFSRICNLSTGKGIESGCVFDYTDKLLKEGADLNGYAAFYGECWFGPVFYDALGWNKKEVFDYVVKNGADFKMPVRDDCLCKQVLDSQGGFYFFDEIMKLNPNTDLNTRNYLSKVVLSCIWKDSDQQDSDRLKKLLAYGADINQINSQGDNALINIFKNNHFGGRDFPYDYEKTLYMINFLISNGININHKNNEGHDALYYLRHCPYEIKNKDYYVKFEKLLTPQNKGELHD